MPSLSNTANAHKTILPMLAATLTPENTEQILRMTDRWMTSPKLDGIRAMSHADNIYTRNLKPLRNNAVAATLLKDLPRIKKNTIFDGEIICLEDDDSLSGFRTTSSRVMSQNAKGFNFAYYIFDYVNPNIDAEERYYDLQDWFEGFLHPHIRLVDKHFINNTKKDFTRQYEDYMRAGYEGLMMQHPKSKYIHKRSTVREAALFKFKTFEESEAVVTGLKPMYRNNNILEVSETGAAKRSKKASGLVETTVLGAFIARDIHNGNTVDIGSGFTDEERSLYYNEEYVGKIVTYKYFPYGGLEKPRHPVFKGFREDLL